MSSTAKNVLFISGIDIGGKVREEEDAWFRRWKDEIDRIQQRSGRPIRVITLRFGSTQTIASAAEAALDAVDPMAPLSVVGYSLGGMVAQEVIARTEERNIDLNCCILIATSGPVAQGEEGRAVAQGEEGRAVAQGEEGIPEPQGEEGIPEPQGEEGIPEPQGEEAMSRRQFDDHALQDRTLLMRAFGVFAEQHGPSATLTKLMDLPSGTRGEWFGKLMQEYGVLSAPARNLVDQLRAATRWLLGWDADARSRGNGATANSFAPLGVPSNSFAPLGVPSNSFAALGVPSNESPERAKVRRNSRRSPRILIVAPELDELFPAEVHAERVKRSVEGNGFTDVEVIRIANSGHELQPKGVFTPEDGAHFVLGCGSLPFTNTARIIARLYRALPILFAILVAILFGALISSLARYADILNRKALRAAKGKVT